MAAPQPNILLITTDQQRFDTVPPYAPDFMRTPHFDHLAREGITFSSAYADCPLCVPSRVTIMTGRYGFNHGLMSNGKTSDVIGRQGTLPTRLRELGYQTAAIGKMHFTPMRARHGFDELILPADYYRQMAQRGLDPQPMRHGLGQNELYPGLATVPESLTLTSWIAEQCVDYIRVRRDPTVPFFLWCSFSKPHPPLDPPEPYYSMYRDQPIPQPIHGDWSTDEEIPEAMKRLRQRHSFDLIPREILMAARAAYYGLVTQIDYNMGRVFAALQDLDLFEDTLILFTSDHGEYLGDHAMGAKGFFHEPAAHVPFVLRLPKSWPDRRHGMVVQSLVSLADILPTLVAGAGGATPQDVDGQNLIGLVRGELDAPRLLLEAMRADTEIEFCGITNGRWKYIWYPEGGKEQFFDLKNDPNELTNLASAPIFKGKKRELKQAVIKRHVERKSPAVARGQLAKRKVQEESERDRRDRNWPGYHTEFFDEDVCH